MLKWLSEYASDCAHRVQCCFMSSDSPREILIPLFRHVHCLRGPKRILSIEWTEHWDPNWDRSWLKSWIAFLWQRFVLCQWNLRTIPSDRINVNTRSRGSSRNQDIAVSSLNALTGWGYKLCFLPFLCLCSLLLEKYNYFAKVDSN